MSGLAQVGCEPDSLGAGAAGVSAAAVGISAASSNAGCLRLAQPRARTVTDRATSDTGGAGGSVPAEDAVKEVDEEEGGGVEVF